MSALRTIGLIFFLGPLAAMLVEPFFEALFDILGWDTENFALPFVDVLTNNMPLLTLVMGIGIGMWVHFFAQKRLVTASASIPIAAKSNERIDARKINAPEFSPSQGSPNADGHHLVPSPDEFFRLSCKRTVDSHELVARFFTRNRSKEPLWIEISEPRQFKLSNEIVGTGGGGGRNPYAPTSNQATIAGRATCYNDVQGLSGTAVASIAFGVAPNSLATKLIMEVDFVIKSQIDKPGGEGDLAFLITADRTRYAAIEDKSD
ncbi:hypothetical protein [Gymnodinialimonas sp. 57CJ19]|uniref:hypothetical protein n=1 Tax=Gymnodinialimonas sp. 57CJ19 TaxID=3138498 RepID=UPI0031346490